MKNNEKQLKTMKIMIFNNITFTANHEKSQNIIKDTAEHVKTNVTMIGKHNQLHFLSQTKQMQTQKKKNIMKNHENQCKIMKTNEKQ